ncbi:MAG: 50S ribosome-binding GTPase, partial [Planctomycetes bacterium]|nr:50S ribosome-binding GTPase [Planctomycetota bacterium]
MSEVHSIRNLCFVGHPSSGKTTLVDALAHLTGASARKGSVNDETSICDTEPEEREKKHTLQLAVVHAEHGGKHWTLMDTPGYPDFVAETDAAIFASDLVVGVVSCTSGVTYNLRKKLERAAELGRPRAIVVTHLDGENTQFDQLVDNLRTAFGETCVPALLPDGNASAFSSVHRTMLDPESPWRQRLMDRVMDACEDENWLTEYLESQEISEEQLDKLMPHAITAGALIPILVCNPESGLAVENCLEYFKRFAPAPDEYEIRDTAGEIIERDPNGQLEATVFCIKSDAHVGKVCFARIWSGTLHQGDTIHGETNAKPEKLGGLFRPIGVKREAIESAGPGMIVAFTKVEHIRWGESFSTAGGEIRKVAAPAPPTPMMAVAITPKTRADEQKMGEALHKLEAEDPTFRVHTDSATHELVGEGMSDLHFQVLQSRLKRRYGVEIETTQPRIAYRETISKPAEGHHRHKKQSGGRGQF